MKRLYITTLLTLFLLVSCDKVDKKNTDKENLSSLKPTKNKKIKPFLHKAKINAKSGLILRKKSSTESEILTKIPFNTTVDIIEFTDKFETIKSNKEHNYYGKWVKIKYQQENGDAISGYVFDIFLDYQFNRDKYKSKATKDTVTVTNEREFMNALSSNRVIWIDANEINLEKLINENIIDDSLIIKNNIELNAHYEIYYFTSKPYKSFFLQGYNNLEIRGKNRIVDITIDNSLSDVLSFDSCNYIVLDNLNFYHKVFDIPGGLITKFYNCTSIFIQNSLFNGGGLSAAQVNNSENFHFLNCDFYGNNKYAININAGNKISIDRCDFYNNALEYNAIEFNSLDLKKSNINISNCYIKDNTTNKTLIEADLNSGLNCNITNCNISNNFVHENIFNFNNATNSNILISNSEIKDNTSIKNHPILINSNYPSFNLNFDNTNISNNIDFYCFTNPTERKLNKESLIEENIFNSASDSIRTKFNTYSYNNVDLTLRHKKHLTYNESTKQLSHKKYLLNGLHRLIFSKEEASFFDFPTNFSDEFYAEGNLINGILEGTWEIKSEKENKQYITYKNGILNGRYTYKTDDTNQVLIEGNYLNNKKDGIWKYYFYNGILKNETTYNNGENIGPFLYYLPDGTLRQKRTSLKNTGTTTSYYPDGKLESIINYKHGNIDIFNSSFYDAKGIKTEAMEIETSWEKSMKNNGLTIEQISSGEYNYKVIINYGPNKQKLFGYNYYRNGKQYDLNYSYFNNNLNNLYYRLLIKRNENDYAIYNYRHQQPMFLYDQEHNLKNHSYIDENYIIHNYKYEKPFYFLKEYSEYRYDKTKTIKHGVHKSYNIYGKLIDNKIYENGVAK